MLKKVVILHTGPVTVQPLETAKSEVLGNSIDLEIVNIVDDSLLKDVMRAGGITKEVRQRISSYFVIAQHMGATAILNACSSVGEAADFASDIVSVPVVKIDNAMAEKAVELGIRIAVLATVKTTLDPTVRLIEKKAKLRSKEITIERYLCSEAFQALLTGDGSKHDLMLINAIRDLASRNDIIVLAQVSMARLTDSLTDIQVPVLTSPKLGMGELAEMLARL